MQGIDHALAPKAEGNCCCPISLPYSSGSHTFVADCTLYLERSRGCAQLPLYDLHCPNGNPACCKKYDGSADGVFLISKTQAVALGHLYRGLDVFHASGASPAAFYSCIQQQYSGPYAIEGMKPPVPLFSENTWREAFFLFLCCILNGKTDQAVPNFCCKLCKGAPKCIIVDGTAATMKSYHFTGEHINSAKSVGEAIRQQHNMNARAFFNVQAERAQVQKEVLKYANAVGSIQDTPEYSLPNLKDCAPILESRDADDANSYGLKPFLQWVDQKVQSRDLSKENRKAISSLLGRNIATNSAVVAYFRPALVSLIEHAIDNNNGVLDRNTVRKLDQYAPALFNVLKIAGARRGSGFTLPAPFIPLLKVLCCRAKYCTEGPGIEAVPELSEDDPRRQQASAASVSCLESGLCTGLPQLRERPVFKADGRDDRIDCNKQFLQGRGRTGGVMTLFCEHGICYAAFVLAGAEGRDHLFSFLVKYLEKPPEVLVYDFGCAALDYCLNRLPGWFKDMLVLIDRLHWDNHIACSSSFNMRLYEDMDGLNSQIAEQCNAALRKINPTLHRSSQPFFMAVLRQYLHAWNVKKQELIQIALQRGARHTC